MGRQKPLHESLPSLGRVVRRFWPYIRQHRLLLTWSFLALAAEIILRLLEPWPLKFVLDRIIVPASPSVRFGLPTLDALDPIPLLTLSALAVVIVTVLRGLAEFFSGVWLTLVGEAVVTEVRGELYAHLQRLSLSFHDRARCGDLLLRVTVDTGVVRDVSITALLPLVTSLASLIAMMGFMLWVNWQLTALALLPLPLAALHVSYLGRHMRETARKARRREGEIAAVAAESIGAMRLVHALSLQHRFSETFASQNQKSLRDAARATKAGARLDRTINIFTAISTAIVLWQGARLVLQGALTPGDLVVYLAYLKNTFKPGRDFAKHTTRIARAAAAGERVLELLDRAPEIHDLPGAVPAPAFRGAVRFENVTFGYEVGRPVLQGISVTVQPGEHVGIMGPSGSGKSTLVSLLLRLYDPTGGRVLIDGRDIRDYTLESLRAQVSIVLQDPWLFAVTVRDNIGYGLPNASFREIEEAARLANAHEFIEALPEQYETVLGERGVTLSNGQRQRIALARAAIRPAPILILDEPTTGLDRENERAVLDALERLTTGRTVFLITHDPELAKRADVILDLKDGRVVQNTSTNLRRHRTLGRPLRHETVSEITDAVAR